MARDVHRFSWPALAAWLLVMGMLDGLVLGESLDWDSVPGILASAVLICASVAWGFRHSPRSREQTQGSRRIIRRHLPGKPETGHGAGDDEGTVPVQR